MTAEFLITLLNPGIGALFAAAFFLLWRNQPQATYIAQASASFAFTSAGFFIQDHAPSLPHELQLIPANLCYLLAAVSLAAAVLGRYKIRKPVFLLTALVAVGIGGQSWFLLVQPDLTARIFFINLVLGALTLYTAAEIFRVKKSHAVDWVLLGVLALAALNFTTRPLAIFWTLGTFGTVETFQQSPYWITSQFAHAIISIVIALNLLVAVAIDLIATIQRDADTDMLSGLLSRRGFEKEAEKILQQSRSAGIPACLLLADLDDFKQINDAHGHAEGDKVIALFGEHIRAEAGSDAVAGRIGGEEFAILLTDVDLGTARAKAEAIRSGLAAWCSGKLRSQVIPTTSIGICYAGREATLSSLLKNADSALYLAKEQGRDQVQVFAPPSPAPVTQRRPSGPIPA